MSAGQIAPAPSDRARKGTLFYRLGHILAKPGLWPRRPLEVGAYVSIAVSAGPGLVGIFCERTTYLDGTPAAWIDLDDGGLVVAPLADLQVLS